MTFSFGRIINPTLAADGGSSGPPAVVQYASNAGAAVSSLQVTLPGVNSGNAIYVLITKSNDNIRTYTTTDNQSNSYSQIVTNDANSGRQSEIQRSLSVTGGSVTITVTPSATANMAITAIELSGVGASPTEATDIYDNGAGTTKYAAQSTGFSPPADSVILAAFAFNANTTSLTGGSGYTVTWSNAPATPSCGLHQYRETASLLTNHRPECTVGDSSRQGPACCVAIS